MLPRPLPLPLRHPRQAPLLLHLVPFLLDRPRPALPPPRRFAPRPRAPRRPARLPLHAGRFIRRVRLRAGGRVRHGAAEHRPRAPQRRRGEASPPAFPPIRRPHSRGNRRTPHNRGQPRTAPQTPLRGESAALPAGKRGNVAPAGIVAVFAERFVDPQPLQRGSNPRGSSGFHGSTVRDSRGSDGSRGSGGCGEPVAADADALRGSPVSPFPSFLPLVYTLAICALFYLWFYCSFTEVILSKLQISLIGPASFIFFCFCVLPVPGQVALLMSSTYQ